MTTKTTDMDLHIVLAGHFDPATMGPVVGGDGGVALAAMSGPPGVPIHHLAIGFTKREIQTTLLGGLRGGGELYVRSFPLSAIVYPKRGRTAWVLDGLRRERNLIAEYLRKIDPTIVHAHWTLEAARAAADWNGPKVLTVQDTAWEYARIGSDWSWGPLAHASTVRWLVNTSAIFERFRHIIAISPYVETYLRTRHGFRGEIRVIPDAVPPLPDNVRIPETFPKTGCITFGCYGSPGRLKNVGAAVSAFLIVHKELTNSRLLVYGSGWEGKTSRYAQLPIEFRGAQPHSVFLKELGSKVDIWVHPSRIETQGIVICEAIQAGCPVIAGHASGAVPWTLDYGQAGVLVDIENPFEIAQAMLALVHNREMALDLVAYGRRMIRERFSLDRIVQMHLDYYQDIVGQAGLSL